MINKICTYQNYTCICQFLPILFLFPLRMKDIELFHQVYTHPSYAENPRGTIHEHLQNKLKQENEMDL